MAKTIPALDLMFFLAETKNNPKHVAALMVFNRPEGAGKRFVADIVAAYRKGTPVPPFNHVAKFSLTRMPRWVEAKTMDMKYHVQHTSLPEAATEEDLLAHIADLHIQLLDRDRPCFRVYFIEGVPGGRFAIFLKVHHAMVDGASAIARVAASLDASPDARAVRPVYSVDPSGAASPMQSRRGGALPALRTVVTQTRALKDLYAGLFRKGLFPVTGEAGNVPFTAPRAATNDPMSSSRSIATLTLSIEEMKAVAKAFDATLNDVAVTIVDAALNRYLREHRKQPKRPLVALCPVSLRDADDREAATKVSSLYAPLGKPDAAIESRMQQVIASLASAKREIKSMSKDTAMLYAITSFGLSETVGAIGAGKIANPLANFVLSNVPGPRTDLYLHGAKMQAVYPISTLGGGIGLNVTLLSYSGSMDFGFVANGAAMPDLDRLADHTRAAFNELKKAAPGAGARGKSAPPASKSKVRTSKKFASPRAKPKARTKR